MAEPFFKKPLFFASLAFFGILGFLVITYFQIDYMISLENEVFIKTIQDDYLENLDERMNFLGASLLANFAFMTHDIDVSREEWQIFADEYRPYQEETGITGFGFQKRTSDKTEFEADMNELRELGLLNREPPVIHDDGFYEYIFFISPVNARNMKATGYDMWSEETRREAMTKARDTGESALSGPVTLVQEITEKKQLGTLIYKAVYDPQKPSSNTLEKRDALLGYSYLALRMGDLLSHVSHDLEYSSVIISDVTGEKSEIYNSDEFFGYSERKVLKTLTTEFTSYGRTWEVAMSFHYQPASNWSIYILIAGIPIAFVISFFVYTYYSKALRLEKLIIEKNLQSQINKAEMEKIVELQKSKDEFLKVISHEIRTPLFQIAGFAELLAEQSVDPELCKSIFKIKSSTKDLNNLLGDLISLLKSQSDNLEFQTQSAYPNQILEKITDSFDDEINEKSIKVKNNIPTDIKCIVDTMRLEQVFRNLLSNSIDYVSNGGNITVTGTKNQDYLQIDFIDDGAGIHIDEVPHIFNSLYVKDTSLRRHGGTGVGLMICKMFVEKMGGKISIDSPGLGKGTTVTFTLKIDKDA